MAWLPRWRTTWKPRRPRARMTSSPETLGGRGNRNLERRQESSVAAFWQWKLLQEELRRFLQIGDRLVQGRSLADRADLGAFGNVEITLAVEDRGECPLTHDLGLPSRIADAFPPTPPSHSSPDSAAGPHPPPGARR